MVKQYKRLFVKQLYGNINARTGSLLQSYLHDIAIDFVGERIGEADDVEGIRETVVANASREADVFQFVRLELYRDSVESFHGLGYLGQRSRAEVEDIPAPEIDLPAILDFRFGKHQLRFVKRCLLARSKQYR